MKGNGHGENQSVWGCMNNKMQKYAKILLNMPPPRITAINGGINDEENKKSISSILSVVGGNPV